MRSGFAWEFTRYGTINPVLEILGLRAIQNIPWLSQLIPELIMVEILTESPNPAAESCHNTRSGQLKQRVCWLQLQW